MTSLLWGLIYGLVVLNYVSSIDFRGYQVYDPSTVPNEHLDLTGLDAVYLKAPNETRITLPPDSGKPEAFKIAKLYRSSTVRIIGNHTKGTAHGVHLVYAKGREEIVYVENEGQAQSRPAKCYESDVNEGKDLITCVSITSGWMSKSPPKELYVFQHVVHSRLNAFVIDVDTYVFYMLRKDDTTALQTDVFEKDANIKVWYKENVEFENENSVTLSSLSSNATTYEKNFILIGSMTIDQNKNLKDERGGKASSLRFYDGFFLVKRRKDADVSKCSSDYLSLGPTRITFRELTETIIFVRNMDEIWQRYNFKCFDVASHLPSQIVTLSDTLETPDLPDESDKIVIYEARASPFEPFYAVSLSYKPELDEAKHGHHVAMVNNVIIHLDDMRYAGEMLYPLNEHTNVVRLFRSTPAIKIKVLPFDLMPTFRDAFKALPYWMDQCMPHMENEPLHNYYEAISHSGPKFERDNIWADVIITKTQCVNTSLPNVSLASFAELVGHHTIHVLINNTREIVERDMSQTYEEYEDFHVDQRNPCNDINVLSKIKRTTKNVSKKDTIILEAKDDEPLRITLNLDEGETFLVRFFNVERGESKCQDLDTVAIFLKDDMLVNQKAYIRTLTYEALTERKKTWTVTGKLTIAIPNGCFRVEVVSVFSIQRTKYMHNIRACIIVMALTIIWSGTAILSYYKFSLAGREYRRLRRMYERAKRHDNLRHYLEWKENVEEIIAAWEKVPDEHW